MVFHWGTWWAPYYLGDIGYAIGMTITLGGFGLWALIDVFFIGKRLENKTAQLERQVIEKVKAMERTSATS